MGAWDDYFKERAGDTAPDCGQGIFAWEDEPAEPDEPKGAEWRLEREFDVFHGRYPELYKEIMRYVRMVRAQGYKHYGIAACIERARWEWDMQPDPRAGEDDNPREPFKISNNHRAYYSRLIMKNNPELDGFFRVKQLRSRDEE